MEQTEKIAHAPLSEPVRRKQWEAPTIEAASIEARTAKDPSIIENNGLFSKSVS
jgi:hypothetical protein